ncbi:toll/interleukin-1 receptor domain-containing protein [Butyricicoccus sp.]|uniref:toll/interleukin-1 receptor domain-containing protein n=1 Tax=Butyricicoccus sp. TaxID=2049021 RepID=UPI003D7D95DB
MYDAFISYRRDNGFLMAQVIHDHLEERGIHCFLDLEELQSGKFDEKIYDSIQDSPNFILILQPGALDRCVDEKDWVRKEILAAVEKNKNIILVLCDGFHWPQHIYSELPEQVVKLENKNAVKSSQDYLTAMIQKLIDFMVEIKSVRMLANRFDTIDDHISEKKYFLESCTEKIQRVDMAFHAGAQWHWDPTGDRTDILYDLLEAGVQLRVLLNTQATAALLADHMRNPRQRYRTFSECISDWKDFANRFPEQIDVRVSALPILRRYYQIHCEDETCDTINVAHYTYTNTKMERNFQSIFGVTSPYFQLYQSEFTYLWEQAAPV